MTAVAEIQLDQLEVPFRAPIATREETWAVRRLVLVRLRTDDGREGLGEAPQAPAEALSATIAAELADRLPGLDPADPTDLGVRLRGIEAVPATIWPTTLRAALETAVADLGARAAGLSLAASASVTARPQVAVNGLVGIDLPEAAARRATALVDAGFRCLKLKGGREPQDALAKRVRAVRAAVGPSVRLRLDVNGAWTSVAEATEAIRALAAFDLEYVEQPLLPTAGPEAMAMVRRAVPVPIAADESVTDPGAASALLEAGAADILVVRLSRLGGFHGARRIAERAAGFGVAIVVSTLFESGVGIAAALHLAATLDGEERAHGLATADLLAADLLAEPLAIRNGQMALPPGAGLGIVLDPTTVDRFQVP